MIKALASIGALQVVTMLILLVRTKGLALMLGPDMVGVMSVVDKLIAVGAQTVSLSLPFAALRFLSPEWERSKKRYFSLARSMRRTMLVLTSLTGLGGAAITAVAPQLLGEELQPYRWIVTAAFMTLPIIGLIPLTQNVIAARFEHNRSMVFSLMHAFVFAATAVGGVALAGLGGLYICYALGGAILLVGAWVRLSEKRYPIPAEPAPAPEKTRFGLPTRIWNFSFALLILTFIAPYASLYISYRILALQGAEAAGWMQAAVGISLSVRAVLGSAHSVFLTPHVNRGGNPADRLDWAVEFQRTLCFVIAVLVPPLLLFPDVFVRLLYSSRFLPGAEFVLGFVVLEIVTLMAGTYQSIIIAMDRLKFHVLQNALASAVTLALAFLLIEPLGILGAALAFLSGQLLLYFGTVSYLRVRCRLNIPIGVQALTAGTILFLIFAGWVGRDASGVALTRLGPSALIYLAGGAFMTVFLRKQDWRRLRELGAELRPGRGPEGT